MLPPFPFQRSKYPAFNNNVFTAFQMQILRRQDTTKAYFFQAKEFLNPSSYFSHEDTQRDTKRGKMGSWEDRKIGKSIEKKDNRGHLNKKFWEVQEPFSKRVLGRRRQKLMVGYRIRRKNKFCLNYSGNICGFLARTKRVRPPAGRIVLCAVKSRNNFNIIPAAR